MDFDNREFEKINEVLADLKEDFKPIDLDDLHNEWNKHCVLMYKYTVLLYGSDEDEGLEAIRSNYKSYLAGKIREENPKIAENKLTNTISEDEIYINLTQKVHLLRGVLDTLKGRGRALEQICKLWIAEYWKSTGNSTSDKQLEQRKALKVERN